MTVLLQFSITSLTEKHTKLLIYLLNESSRVKHLVKIVVHIYDVCESNNHITNNTSATNKTLKLRLLEFKKYGKDFKEQLSFWCKLYLIHADTEPNNEDKFQYCQEEQ